MFDPARHHRRSVRLRAYDYSQPGAYFVTICAQGRECLFGTIAEGIVQLSPVGRVVESAWMNLPHRFVQASLDIAVVMPNHWHGILFLQSDPCKGGGGVTPPLPVRPTLGKIVAFFKYETTKAINALHGTPGKRVWQRSFYEHVIRDDRQLDRLRQYIADNPARWLEDQLHPDNPSRW